MARTPLVSLTVAFVLCLPAPHAVAALGDCGQPQSTGTGPKTGDALAALKTAVATDSKCDETPCACDVDSNGKVTTSDAQKILRKAVAQPVTLDCDCESQCLTFDGSAAASPAQATVPVTPHLDVRANQIDVEVKFVEVETAALNKLGFDFLLSTNVTTDPGPRAGGINGAGEHLAVSSAAAGGAAGVDYFVHAAQRPDGALAILNKNFVSPFDGLKAMPMLPTTQCVLFGESATTTPSGYPNKGPAGNLPPEDFGFGGKLFIQLLSDAERTSLLELINGQTNSVVVELDDVSARSGQAVDLMLSDVTPSIDQVQPDFKAKITEVTPQPFGIFSGVALEVIPHANEDGNVTLELRPGVRELSFFLSTAFMVGGTPVDAEIPVRKPSRNVAMVEVPAGKSLVIEGLQRQGDASPTAGLPVLGDLPLVGSSFTHRFQSPSTHRLIVILKPTLSSE